MLYYIGLMGQGVRASMVAAKTPVEAGSLRLVAASRTAPAGGSTSHSIDPGHQHCPSKVQNEETHGLVLFVGVPVRYVTDNANIHAVQHS